MQAVSADDQASGQQGVLEYRYGNLETPVTAKSIEALVESMNVFQLSGLYIAQQAVLREYAFRAWMEIGEEQTKLKPQQTFGSINEEIKAHQHLLNFHLQCSEKRELLQCHLSAVKELLEAFTTSEITAVVSFKDILTAIIMAWVVITNAEELENAVDITRRSTSNAAFGKAIVRDAFPLRGQKTEDQMKTGNSLKFDQIYQELLRLFHQKSSRSNETSIDRQLVARYVHLSGLIDIASGQLPILKDVEKDLLGGGINVAQPQAFPQPTTSATSSLLARVPKLSSSKSTFANLKISSDVCHVPSLEPAIQALEMAYNSAKKVSIYRSQTAALISKCDEVLITIRDNAGRVEKTRLDASVKYTIIAIVAINYDMVKWSKYSTWRCWWERQEYREMLGEYAFALEQCIEPLGLPATFEPVNQVKEVNDMIEEDQQNLKAIAEQVDQIHSKVAGFHAPPVSTAPGSSKYIEATKGSIDLSIDPPPYVLRPSNLDGEIKKISDDPLFCGSTYDTYKGLWLGKFSVAMKVLRGTANMGARPQDVRRFERQIDLWRNMKHKHVLDLKGYCTINGNQVCLVSPWMENRDVVWYLHKTPEANRFQLITDVAIGLEYLHSIQIFHGGLQPHRILVASEGHALLAGFGLSKLLKGGEQAFYTQEDEPVSEFRYQPPEVMSGQPLNTSCDIYSWAMCALEIMTGHEPFYYIKPVGRLIKAIHEHQFPARSQYTSPALEQYIGLWEILEACWNGDPTKRPTITQVLVSLEAIRYQSAA